MTIDYDAISAWRDAYPVLRSFDPVRIWHVWTGCDFGSESANLEAMIEFFEVA